MTYPHRERTPGVRVCLCGAIPGNRTTSTWGADCPVAMREHIATLTTTLRDLRAQLDHIAHVGWDASCEAAADALEAEDATRLNRYAVRVARERDEARAELDALLVERTGMDSAGWAAERASHDAFMVAENRRGGAVECPDCGRIRFVDGGPDIDLSPSRCQMCERKAADTEVAQLRRTLSALDCRYTGGGVADVSGSHCPMGAPCGRCAGERGREEAREEGRREGMEAVAAVLDDGFDPWPAVRRTVNVGAMDERARSGIDAILDAVLSDACREIRALAEAARESAARVDGVEGDL